MLFDAIDVDKDVIIFIFDSKFTQATDKSNLLRRAIKKHTVNTISCSNGNGIDRHFLGLRQMFSRHSDELGPMPQIFTDPVFAKSGSGFKLSTSNVSPSTWHSGGFGPGAIGK